MCGRIDPGEKSDLRDRFDLRSWGIPTIVLYRSPQDIRPYRGPHRKDEWVLCPGFSLAVESSIN